MNFFSMLWMKLSSLFKSANIQLLEPVPTETQEEEVESPAEEVVTEAAPVKAKLGQLSKNFHVDEFACHDGTAVPEELQSNVLKLAINLQVLRDHLGKPVNINSGFRHPAYNRKVGGAKNSQHMKATAADIKVKGIGPDKLASIIEDLISKGLMEKGGVGRYPTFTHYDVRGKNARWGGTRKKG